MTTIRSLRALVVALVTLVLLGVGLASPSTAATTTGTVKGVVTLAGTPLKGVKVELYWTGDDGYDEPRLATATTDSKGAYAFTVDTRGSAFSGYEYAGHTVIARDPQGRAVATSRTVQAKAGRTVTRNVTMKQAGSITGSVKRGDGAATQRLRVHVFGPETPLDPDRDLPYNYAEVVKVASDGSFSLIGLPAGDYRLKFVDEGGSYYAQCYDNAPVTDDCDDATPITVAAGQHVTLSPQVLTTAGRRIRGTVTDTSGHPIKDAYVTATRGGDEVSVFTSSSGAFTLGPLADGTYQVSVSSVLPWAGLEPDRTVEVSGSDVSDLQLKLKSEAKIVATLTPGKGTVKAAVDVTRRSSGSKPSGKVTVSWGSVTKTVTLSAGKATTTLTGLPAGRRKITISYSGTSSTAAATKVVYAVVK